MSGTIKLNVDGKDYRIRWNGDKDPQQEDIDSITATIRSQAGATTRPAQPSQAAQKQQYDWLQQKIAGMVSNPSSQSSQSSLGAKPMATNGYVFGNYNQAQPKQAQGPLVDVLGKLGLPVQPQPQMTKAAKRANNMAPLKPSVTALANAIASGHPEPQVAKQKAKAILQQAQQPKLETLLDIAGIPESEREGLRQRVNAPSEAAYYQSLPQTPEQDASRQTAQILATQRKNALATLSTSKSASMMAQGAYQALGAPIGIATAGSGLSDQERRRMMEAAGTWVANLTPGPIQEVFAPVLAGIESYGSTGELAAGIESAILNSPLPFVLGGKLLHPIINALRGEDVAGALKALDLRDPAKLNAKLEEFKAAQGRETSNSQVSPPQETPQATQTDWDAHEAQIRTQLEKIYDKDHAANLASLMRTVDENQFNQYGVAPKPVEFVKGEKAKGRETSKTEVSIPAPESPAVKPETPQTPKAAKPATPDVAQNVASDVAQKVAAKEPWQMTAEEFSKDATVERGNNIIFVKHPNDSTSFTIRSLDTSKYTDVDAAARSHRDYVRNALSEGKPVPTAVVDEFLASGGTLPEKGLHPDLAAKYEKQKEVGTTQPTQSPKEVKPNGQEVKTQAPSDAGRQEGVLSRLQQDLKTEHLPEYGKGAINVPAIDSIEAWKTARKKTGRAGFSAPEVARISTELQKGVERAWNGMDARPSQSTDLIRVKIPGGSEYNITVKSAPEVFRELTGEPMRVKIGDKEYAHNSAIRRADRPWDEVGSLDNATTNFVTADGSKKKGAPIRLEDGRVAIAVRETTGGYRIYDYQTGLEFGRFNNKAQFEAVHQAQIDMVRPTLDAAKVLNKKPIPESPYKWKPEERNIVSLEQKNNAKIEIGPEKSVVTFLKEAPDATNAVHEYWHHATDQLFNGTTDVARSDQAIMEEWIGRKYKDWTRADLEKTARAGERYLTTGKAPNLKVKPVFERIKGWMQQVYRNISRSPIKAEVPDHISEVFDRWLGGKEDIPVGETPKATTTAHADIDAIRTVVGWDPRESNPEKIAQWGEEAKALKGKEATIADEITSKPRQATKAEEVALGNRLVKLLDERDKAKASGNAQAFDLADAEANKIADALDVSGSEWGRQGVARQIVLNGSYDDFSLKRRAVKAKGEDLTKVEAAKVQELSDRVAELERKLLSALADRRGVPRADKTIIGRRKSALSKISELTGKDVLYQASFDQMQALREVARTYVEEGQYKLDDVVASLKKHNLPFDDAELMTAARAAIGTESRLANRGRTFGEDIMQAGQWATKDPEIAKMRAQLEIAKMEADAEVRSMQPKDKLHMAIQEGAGAIRAVKLAFDLGAMLRQGFMGLIHNPKMWGKAQVKGAEAMLGHHGMTAKEFETHTMLGIMEREIDGRYMAPIRKRAELQLSNHLNPEEAYMAQWIKKIPGLGKYYEGTERYQATMLNVLRADMFDQFAAKFPGATDAELKQWGSYVNNAIGRSNIKEVNAAAQLVFTSPRWLMSRIGLLSDVAKALPTMHKSVASRAIVLEAAKAAATVYGGLKLLEMAGMKVNWDPQSSDFLKARDGDTVFDFTAAEGRTIRTFMRVAMGNPVVDEVGRFLGNSVSPGITVPYQLATAAAGKPKGLTGREEPIDLGTFGPLLGQQFYQQIQKDGWTGALKSLPEFVGISSQQYPEKKPTSRK